MPTWGGLTGAKSATWRVRVLNSRTPTALVVTAPHDTRPARICTPGALTDVRIWPRLGPLVGSSCGEGAGWLGGAPPDQYAQSGGQLLGSERGGHCDLDPFGDEQRGHAGGVDQYIVVSLVVAAPRAIRAAHERGDLADEPAGCRQPEAGDDRPVVVHAGGGRGGVPGLPVGKVADVDGEQAARP